MGKNKSNIEKMKLGLLASGTLGSNVLQHLVGNHHLEFVMTDENSHDIIRFTDRTGIPVFKGNPRKGRSRKFIDSKEIDVLISVNYLFLIEEDLINLPKKVAFNIHGSLLPKYRGRTPHVWSIINNEEETGLTAHIIDKGCDSGDIIKQIKTEITPRDTGWSLLKKFDELSIVLVESVLEMINSNSLNPIAQDHSKATFFVKRVPEDGMINWMWQKERILNWVRAQTDPYPGAFSFYKKNKIIIDEVEFSDYGFSHRIPNGTILTLNPLRVKSTNGALRITRIRNSFFDFEVGEAFD